MNISSEQISKILRHKALPTFLLAIAMTVILLTPRGAILSWFNLALLLLALLGLLRHWLKLDIASSNYAHFLPLAALVGVAFEPTALFAACLFILFMPLYSFYHRQRRRVVYRPNIRLSSLGYSEREIRIAALIQYYLTLGATLAIVWLPLIALGLTLGCWLLYLVMLCRLPALTRRIARYEQSIFTHLDALQPEFAFFVSGTRDVEHHFLVWAEYFEKTKRKWIVITPQLKNLEVLTKLSTVPVLYARRMADREQVVRESSLKAFFYPNNNMVNETATTIREVKHIHLGHGDSDKATSYVPAFAKYDKICVAGEAAIERFANHGVDIPLDKFEIIGRPQVAGVVVEALDVQPKTVLYAPTWSGATEKVNYSSLASGLETVQTLLDLGLKVVFRPHPESRKSKIEGTFVREIDSLLARDKRESGREHLFAAGAEDKSLIDCINLGDLLISDVSSVISDFLYSEKPIIQIAMGMTDEQFVEEFPIAKCSYLVPDDLANLKAILQNLLSGQDQKRAIREQFKKFYLGDFGTQSPDKVFSTAVNNYLDSLPERIVTSNIAKPE